MLWEIDISPKRQDSERNRILQDYALLTGNEPDHHLLRTSRGYLVEGDLSREEVERVTSDLLVDALVEVAQVTAVGASAADVNTVTILLKAGVMDPAALSVIDAARDLGIVIGSVRSFRRYVFRETPEDDSPALESWRRVVMNDAIEQLVKGHIALDHLTIGSGYAFQRVTVPLRGLSDTELERRSRDGQLSLSLAEMQTVQRHFESLGREPTDVELETIAQTWSEHCSHKTLKGRIDFDGRHYENLLKETIFRATQEIRQRLGPNDWCVSVFEDNAGVVRFDDRFHVCFKVETHNHPSAIEPYGGANTGLGGVIRDLLGTGLGAKPICNTDVFCFAPPDQPVTNLPPGVLHPRKIMQGVVSGVRDYGNRMGIPTVNGAVCFDQRYLANPLVFCGTVGLLPIDRAEKKPLPGDLIVALGGRTGRDGIHGATFSSVELSAESERVSSGAVQIGNPITQKKLMDVLLQARDRGLYHAVTDCGAGGFSSAIGEMGEKIGATVHLDRAPLKYEGLSYTEIWISESQERMILAVPPTNWPVLEALCQGEDVEATALGTFEPTGKLQLYYHAEQVADLEMSFLHDGRPAIVRRAVAPVARQENKETRKQGDKSIDLQDALLKILAAPNVCSKEWIVRQYDHEVQGGSAVKPLVGVDDDGPGDAAVVIPVLGSWTGIAVGCGINPHYGDLDCYAMAAAVIDEAVRNVVAVGADPARIALLDNFCWGNTERPEILGSLVRAAEACRDVALAYQMPFISGKDSLNNEYHAGGQYITIPATLLISALGRVPDVRQCVTMDLKEPGNVLLLIGATREEMGGSHFNLINGLPGGTPPRPDLAMAPRIFAAIHQAIRRGLVRSCHDLSEGGLAIAVAEMAFSGGVGADLANVRSIAPDESDTVRLFSESTTRFLAEVAPGNVAAFRACFDGVPLFEIGRTVREPRLRIAGGDGSWIVWAELSALKEAWQSPLRWP